MKDRFNSFYSGFLKEYHLVKSVYLKSLMSQIDVIDENLKTFRRNPEEQSQTKFILQADLRQNYFHSIETLFELFFALLPENGLIPDNHNIVRSLSQSKWPKNYNQIKQIADGEIDLDKLFEKRINYNGKETSIGNYLFYFGVFSHEKFPKKTIEQIQESIHAIAFAIKAFAKDFSDRNEYNAYKHGLRIFPAFKSVHIFDKDTAENRVTFDLSNSLSYYLYDDKKQKITIKSKVFDSERDYKLTIACSYFIYNIIFMRDIALSKPKKDDKNEQFAIHVFNVDGMKDNLVQNIQLQELEFSEEKISKGSS